VFGSGEDMGWPSLGFGREELLIPRGDGTPSYDFILESLQSSSEDGSNSRTMLSTPLGSFR